MTHERETVTAHTFCVLLPRLGLFHRRRQYDEWLKEIFCLEGLIGVAPLAKRVLLIHMAPANDAIIARNHLRFIGFCISEETHETEIERELVLTARKGEEWAK